MGSRTTDKLKEIEELRSSLENKLGELERRFPVAGLGRKAAAALGAGSAGGTALAFVVRRMRKRRRKDKKDKSPAVSTAPVTVNVLPKGAAWIAAAGLAVWAGAKLYESINKAKSGDGDAIRPSVVRPIPDAGRQSGAGS